MNVVPVKVRKGLYIIAAIAADGTYCVFTHEGTSVPVRYSTYAQVTEDVANLRSVDRAQGYWPSTAVMSRSEYEQRLTKFKAALSAA